MGSTISTKDLGPVLAIGVAVGMFVMLTLLPALLVSFPRGSSGRIGPHPANRIIDALDYVVAA